MDRNEIMGTESKPIKQPNGWQIEMTEHMKEFGVVHKSLQYAFLALFAYDAALSYILPLDYKICTTSINIVT